MNDMTYKGYAASIKYSAEDGCLIGRLTGIKDIVTFHGDSVAEIRQVFEESVEEYLNFCAELSQEPQRPAAEEIVLEVPAELHARLLNLAQKQGKSIGSLVIETLSNVPSPGA